MGLIYTIPCNKHDIKTLETYLYNHPEIKFVSLMGIDIGGNATDEKIPIKNFLNNMKEILNHGIQTDGSSVILHGIATLDNARVDIVPDTSVNWFVDYNYELISEENSMPVGTLKIPSFLIHNKVRVDSRSILKRSINNFKDEIIKIIRKYPSLIKNLSIKDIKEIDDIILTAATELELWVKTPDSEADLNELSISQSLKEQYWKLTKGTVRTALEKSILLLDKYNFKPEMGHKEVGGVTGKISIDGKSSYVVEQLEIDWKYTNPLQASDNELVIKDLITEVFRLHGLEVTFLAKPFEEVAGNGEHTHIGVCAKLKNGKLINLFSPKDMKKDYLSSIGYGALMGILKNYEVISPFVTTSINGFNRLKPGFEAPVCTVTSLGKEIENPTRNRSVLIGLIRDIFNPLSTRFELRSPNPNTNTYLVLASIYQAMLDGIKAVGSNNKTSKELEREISKKALDESFYLEKEREYRCEENVYNYSDDLRKVFGIATKNPWENISNINRYSDKKSVLLKNEIFTDNIIKSFKLSTLDKWVTELNKKVILNNINILREYKKLHIEDNDLDNKIWEEIYNLKCELMKDSLNKESLFTKIKKAIKDKNYGLVSMYVNEMDIKMETIKALYIEYKTNIF